MNLNRIDGPRLNPLLPDSVFTSSIIIMTGSYRPPSHRRGAHRNFFR